MVGFGTFKNNTFIRLVIVNCENSVDDIMRFFKILEDFTHKNKFTYHYYANKLLEYLNIDNFLIQKI